MKIYYDDSRCGDGKTYAALEQAASTKGKYIFAIDKVAMVSQRKAELRKLSAKHGTDPRVITINADTREDSRTVVELIEQLPDTYTAGDHLIVIVTHASMKEARFDGRFSDWSIFIDEDFSVFSSDSWTLAASKAHLEENYNIVPLGDVFQVRAKEKAFSVNDYRVDSAFGDNMADFRKLVELQVVMTDKPKIDTDFRWWSIWSYTNLAAFSKVTILANAFTEKLSFQLASLTGDVEFERVERNGGREWKSRPVRIVYFSEEMGSKKQFATAEGARNIEKIADWCEENYDPERRHFWSSNHGFSHELSGSYIRPMSAGRNDLKDCDVGTFIYTALATPVEAAILSKITAGKIGNDLVKRDREFEAISQFVLRGGLRVPDSTKPFELRVYSREQAEFVEAFLARNHYVSEADIVLEMVDLGFEKATKARGPKVTVLTDQERSEKEATKRAKSAARMKRMRERQKMAA